MSDLTSKTAKPKIFISYSRVDEKFVDELVAGLDFDGRFEVRLDRQSIVEGEDWKVRLSALIADADTVIFVLSPHAAQSSICLWEVDEAHRLSKRILPVLAEELGESAAPAKLAALNYVRFDEGRSFIRGLAALTRALTTDLDWIREHSRLLARAMEWEAAGRLPNRMLSGNDIALAKAWIANRPKDAPELTDLHFAFIRASELEEESRLSAERVRLAEIADAQRDRAVALSDRELAVTKLSRRTTIGIAASGTLTALAGGLAYWGVNAEARFRASEEERQRQKKREEEQRRMQGALRTDIEGQLVAYAASPGQDAMDPRPGERNSPYTKVLLRSLAQAETSLAYALQYEAPKVIAEVSRAYEGRMQRPYFSTDMNGVIYLLDQPRSRKRKALCVSVGSFLNAPEYKLKTKEDADDWAEFLTRAGFEVSRLHDPDKQSFQDTIEAITFLTSKKAESEAGYIKRVGLGLKEETPSPLHNTLAMLFYSGVGHSKDGRQYILTNDVKVEGIESTSLELSWIQKKLRDQSAASVLILDTDFQPKADAR